jgi:hypothetical protein
METGQGPRAQVYPISTFTLGRCVPLVTISLASRLLYHQRPNRVAVRSVAASRFHLLLAAWVRSQPAAWYDVHLVGSEDRAFSFYHTAIIAALAADKCDGAHGRSSSMIPPIGRARNGAELHGNGTTATLTNVSCDGFEIP